MDFREFKLSALLEISKAINANMPSNKLYLLLKFFLKNQLKIERIWLINRQKEKFVSVISENAPLSIQASTIDFLKKVKHKVGREVLLQEGLEGFSSGFPIIHNGKIKAYLLLGWNNEGDHFSVGPILKNVGFIQTLANLVVVAVENQELTKQRIENERIKKELELAAGIQSFLIPKKLPKEKGFSASAYYKPFHEIGGDYYDWIPLGNGKHFFCIADIAGKGIQAAIIMANFQARIKSHIFHHNTFANFVQHLNENVFELTNGDSFITFFGAIYNIYNRELTYVNAGHFGPFLNTEKEVQKLSSFYPGLGMAEEIEISESKTISLTQDSCLICYTDGVMDIETKEGVYLGEEGVEKMLTDQSFELPREIIAHLLGEIKTKIEEGGKYSDDLTLLALHLGAE